MGVLSEGTKRDPLYKPKNLVMRKVDDFYLALNPDLPNIMVMDDVGKRFFELCNGSFTVDETLEKIIIEREGAVTKDELFKFISSMLDANFLFLKPPPSPQKIERRPEKARRLSFHLTRACNLRCKHCYVEAGEPLENELTTPEVLRIIEDFAQLGGEYLLITGGEPFLRRETLYEALRKGRKVGIPEIFVATNGTLISNEDMEVCKKYDVEIGVSLDGAIQETNDYIRGAGSYEKCIKTIKKLISAGIKVKINMTLMKPNIKEAEKMVYLAKDLGINSIIFTPLLPIGRAKINKDLQASFEEILSASSTAWEKAKEVGIAAELEELEDVFKSGKLTREDMCGAGTEILLVSSKGDLYPCNMFFEFEEFNAGNVRERGLRDTWKNSKVLKKLRRLSVLDIKSCKDCELKFICAVCPAEIYKEHGGFNEKPKRCSFYKKTLWMKIEENARKMWRGLDSRELSPHSQSIQSLSI